jgi:ABC-type oligopeptide transport system substrate-binding subunit
MRRFLAGLLALSLLAAVGCSKATDNKKTDTGSTTETKKEQVIRVNIGTDPKDLNPVISTGVPESNVETQLFAGLMRLNKNGQSEPDQAQRRTFCPPVCTHQRRARAWQGGA